MNKADVFVPENEKTGHIKEHTSPSGKYTLVVKCFTTGPHSWDYSQGTVYGTGVDKPIAVIQRNYGAFPFLWIEDHSNGHSYLVAGEDYQGQTVIELDTGNRKDYLPETAKKGHGFCWAQYRFEAAHNVIVVDGCFWACGYEYRFFDFSDPMSGWPEIDVVSDAGYIGAAGKWPLFNTDGTIQCFEVEDCDDPTSPDTSIKTFKRDRDKLLFVSEWVSEQEKLDREKRAESERKYQEWKESFKTTDPLYLKYSELLKDTALSPEKYESVGIVHEGWCKDYPKSNEQRWCRRIVTKTDAHDYTIDLEWAVEKGPIKLVIFKGGKHVEDKFFPHSVEGMNDAFAYAKQLIGTKV